MKTKKILLLVSALFLLGVLALGFYRGNYGYVEIFGEPLSYRPQAFDNMIADAGDNPGMTRDIHGYKRGNVIYLFLPEGADLKRIVYYAADENGRYMKRFIHNFEQGHADFLNYRVTALQSGLPALYLDIDGGHGSLENVLSDEKHQTYAYGNMWLDVPEETAKRLLCDADYMSVENDPSSPGTMGFRGRGNKTWEFDKRPFQLELEKKQDLLGMGKAKKWVLLANAIDDTLLKNRILYRAADRIGLAYSPRMEPVDLYIDGHYQGSYLLATKPEVGQNRVDIDEKEDLLLEWGGTNAKLNMEFERTAGMPYWWVKSHSLYSARAVADLEPRIQEILDQIMDIKSGAYAESIDLTSWAKYYWMQEVCLNGDAVYTSIYMYYIRDEDKLYMGPVWDLDNTCGYPPEREHRDPVGFSIRGKGWYTYLFQHEDFAREVERVYRDGGMEEKFKKMLGDLSAGQEYVYSSAVMDYLRWKQPEGVDLTPEEAGDAYRASVEKVRLWLEERLGFIAGQMED